MSSFASASKCDVAHERYHIMLALCLMLLGTYYAYNSASIISGSVMLTDTVGDKKVYILLCKNNCNVA